MSTPDTSAEPTSAAQTTPFTCAGCGRALFEKTVLRTFAVDGLTCSVVEYRKRPWAAVVHTRVKEVVEASLPAQNVVAEVKSSGLLTARRNPLQRTVTIREFPWVCSRPCLEAVRASREYAFTSEMSESVRFDLMRPSMKDGDDMLMHTLGSEGPPPDAPSDTWIVVDSQRGRLT